jgi:putative phosphonate metabolism protein
MTGRYAIYWAPATYSLLACLGEAWLGRSAEGAAFATRPEVAGIADAALAAITAEPRRYGLHATLKPPFRLAAGGTRESLATALADFARSRAPVVVPPLRLKRIGRFLALVPGARLSGLDALAAACVEYFDGFRAAPDVDEIARRRSAGLKPAHEENLRRWGYPYVMAEFRFHVTLTGPLDGETAARLEPALAALFAPAMATPLELRDLSLFHEPSPGAPFSLLRRATLGGESNANRRPGRSPGSAA